MRYRTMSPDGDYVFMGNSPFLINSPQAVAQAIKTRMNLFTREWFLDKRVGLDKELILGYGTQGTRDQQVQERIIGTPGVLAITAYSSSVDADRAFTVAARVSTIYGEIDINEVF